MCADAFEGEGSRPRKQEHLDKHVSSEESPEIRTIAYWLSFLVGEACRLEKLWVPNVKPELPTLHLGSCKF